MAVIGNIGQNRAGLSKQPIRWAAPPVNEQAQSVSKSTGLINSGRTDQQYGSLKTIFFGSYGTGASLLPYPLVYRAAAGQPSYTFLKPAILVGAVLSSSVYNNAVTVNAQSNIAIVLHRDVGGHMNLQEGAEPLVEQIFALATVGSMRNGVSFEDKDAILFGNNEKISIYFAAGNSGTRIWSTCATLRFREVI